MKKEGYLLHLGYSGGKFTLEGENEGFVILCHNEFTDVDGTLIGVVLAKSKTQFATWRYSFFPKSEYFTGFNAGHYFSNEISAKTDYFERLSEMGNRLKSEINKTCCKIEEDIEI